MFCVHIIGRLGNQMFQIAFAYILWKKYKTNFFLKNEGSHKLSVHKYFKIKNFCVLKNILANFIINSSNYSIKKIDCITQPDDIIESLPKNINKCLFSGYYQSNIYYKNNLKEIRNLFEIKRKYKIQFDNKYGSIFKNNKIIAIHIRLSDYVESNYNLPYSYYQNCLNNISNLMDYKLIFVSDDIITVKKMFGQRDNYLFEQNEQIVDFQIIQNADIAIISNSSFSWWAAYLSIKNNNKVYAPKNWLNFNGDKEFPIGIMINKWNWEKVK